MRFTDGSGSAMGRERYSGLYILNGPPGTGKTSWLRNQVREINAHNVLLRRPTELILCSLTRTAAAEISSARPGEDKLPIDRWRIGTLHSHAFKTLERPAIAELKENIAGWNAEHEDYALGGTVENGDLDEPGFDFNPSRNGDGLYATMNLLRNRLTDRAAWPASVRDFADKWERWKLRRGLVDFTGLIETALDTVPAAPGNPLYFIGDEAQDFSCLEYALARKWIAAAQAGIIAGDPWQSLYSWRGADPEIFFDKSVPKDHSRVLGQSHRIPVAVHRAAMAWARGLSTWRPLEYKPTAVAGSLGQINASWRNPMPIILAAERHVEAGKRVMIQAACSYMLEPLLSALRKRGTPFANPWRPTRGDWNPLRLDAKGSTLSRLATFLQVDESMGDRHKPEWTFKDLNEWSALLRAKGILKRGAKTQIAALAEEEDEIAVTREDLRALFVDDQAARIERMLDDIQEGGALFTMLDWMEEGLIESKRKAAQFPMTIIRSRGAAALSMKPGDPTIYVGTIHSFKGGEADVCYLFPDLSSAGAREWSQGGLHRDSVIRLFYVALTRARERVVKCAPASAALAVKLF